MPFWLWLLISMCFVVYVTTLAVRSARSGESRWRVARRWVVNVWDILSGGG